jgi:hypothetical protein
MAPPAAPAALYAVASAAAPTPAIKLGLNASYIERTRQQWRFALEFVTNFPGY